MGKRVGLPTEGARKVDLIYFAGFKCALEDCYKHQHIDIRGGPNPLADLDPPGPNPLADLDPLRRFGPPHKTVLFSNLF